MQVLLSIVLMSAVLDHASHSAETFWTQVSAIECTEQIAQTRVKAGGRIAAHRSSTFDYLVTLKANGPSLTVDESRIPQESTQGGQSLLVTSGFPMLMLIFHPDFRDRFDFKVDEAKGKIAFRAKPTARSFSTVKVDGRVYPILWDGTAWVDPGTGAVRRIEASSPPMTDIGVDRMNVVVEYGSVPFSGQSLGYWLPSRATISLRSPRQQWTNVHEFRSYKLFSVTTKTRMTEPQ
jgi:hypothetical protein